MVTEFPAMRSVVPGWVKVHCHTQTSAEWLIRAIVMENVSARSKGPMIEPPAGPEYRLEKELKNVITAIAKTNNYCSDHMWPSEQQKIADSFLKMSLEKPLIQPATPGHDFSATAHNQLHKKMTKKIAQTTGLQVSDLDYPGWIGVDCSDVGASIWMMRVLAASNILARREKTVIFVPVSPVVDPSGEIVVKSLAKIHGFARVQNRL